MQDLLLQLIQQVQTQNSYLERIAESLEKMSGADATRPKYVKPIADFPNFDWSSIGAVVTQSDRYGAAVVSWRGQMYVRRSKADFGEDVWFSRGIGKDESGRNTYETLIKFTSPPKARSLPQDIMDVVR